MLGEGGRVESRIENDGRREGVKKEEKEEEEGVDGRCKVYPR